MKLPPKKRPGHLVLASDWNQLVDAVAARTPRSGHSLDLVHSSGGFYYRAKPVAAPVARAGRFIVSYDQEKQRLHVSPGAVFTAKCNEDKQAVEPVEPTLDGTPLSQHPHWSVASKPNGTPFNVWCVFRNHYTARMVLRDRDESLTEGSNPVLKDDENAVLIAEVTWKSEDDAKKIDSLVQLWESDIGWFFSDVGSVSSSTDEDSSEPPDDSSDEEPPDSSDDSDSSSSGSSSGSGSCCPSVTIESAVVMMVGAEASLPPEDWVSTAVGYSNAGVPEDTMVYVSCSVGTPGPGCDAYRGRLWLKVSVGGVTKSVYLGGAMSGPAYTQHLFSAMACSDYEVNACIEVFGAPVSGGLAGISGCCAEPFNLQMPPVLGETC